jgi:hypothetical protein
LEVGAAVQSLPNYCRLKRQNAVLLAAVRNGVIAAKHAFYRLHRAFIQDFVRRAEAPLFVVLMDHKNTALASH